MPALDHKEAESLFAEALENPKQAHLPSSSTESEIAPSLIAEQPAQAMATPEVQSQLLNLWSSSRREDDNEQREQAVDDDDESSAVEGMAMEFVPDSQISAADYLAPDDSGSAQSSGGGSSSGGGGTIQS